MDQEQDEVHGNRYSQYRSVYYLFPCPGFSRDGWSLFFLIFVALWCFTLNRIIE